MNRKTRTRLSNLVFRDIPVILFLLFMLFPFYWILNTSLKDSVDVVSIPIQYWPAHPTLENFRGLISLGFDRYFLNSLFVASFTTLIIMALSLLGGYAMSRYRFKGRTVVYIMLLATQMLPAVVLMIPLFQIMNEIGRASCRERVFRAV